MVFQRLGPRTHHDNHVERPSRDDLELEEEDKYHRPRWCPDGLSRSQKHIVQRLRILEEAEARYLAHAEESASGSLRASQAPAKGGKAPSKEGVAPQAAKSR